MSDTNTVELATPVEQMTGDDVAEVREKYADVAAALASSHPPTNRNLLWQAGNYWQDIAGPNDPIVESFASWLCYLSHDDVSQFDAGMTGDQHRELEGRLEELGLTDG